MGNQARPLLRSGATIGAVNFIEVSLPAQHDATRFNEVFWAKGLNIARQHLRTDADIGSRVTDIEGHLEARIGVRRQLAAISGTTRPLPVLSASLGGRRHRRSAGAEILTAAFGCLPAARTRA